MFFFSLENLIISDIFDIELTTSPLKQMLIHLCQAIFAASHTLLRAIFNIALYSVLSRIFLNWFGFNTLLAFVCTAWCITKITTYVRRFWLTTRLQNKKPIEKIIVNELVWKCNEDDDSRHFKENWNKLMQDDYEHSFASIVRVPFDNGWLCFGVMIFIDYLTNNTDLSYLSALFCTVGFVVLVCCGSSIRYQTLLNREKQVQEQEQDDDSSEKYLVLSNNIPVAALKIKQSKWNNAFNVVFYSCHSKYMDYITDIANFSLKNVLHRIAVYCSKYDNSQCQILWNIPTYKIEWTYALQVNGFTGKTLWTEFAYLPFVKSTVTQYQYDLTVENNNDDKSHGDNTKNNGIEID
ncbi:unnamed protein product [Didymodactylos carnosus]|uniref:Uncharacterized protein n=1 Tax=Didymodactylos carnosus TaxID=1234261 RepID=A0A813QW83_9BILA|nr:unnamed protein product [Didymodactylos carnosus]CAF3556980.1 unnamed protein product [Didymodactylos carnosus]